MYQVLVHSEPLIKAVVCQSRLGFFASNLNFVGEASPAGEFKGASLGAPDVGVGFWVASAIVTRKFVSVDLKFAI